MLSWPRRAEPRLSRRLKLRQAAGLGSPSVVSSLSALLHAVLDKVKSVSGSMSRVPAGACELTRRRSARRIGGQGIPAGVRLRSLRCSLGSTVKDVELGVVYRRVAAGILSAVLFLAALVSIGYCMELGGVQTKLCRNPPTRGVRVGSPKSGKTQTAPPPASCETGASFNQVRQVAASLRATNVGNVAAALRAADLASAKTAAGATDDLRLAAGCRPSGGAVDSPPQAVTSRMCASGSQDERGLASASVKAAALGVYVVTACPSPHHWSLLVSLNGICQRE